MRGPPSLADQLIAHYLVYHVTVLCALKML